MRVCETSVERSSLAKRVSVRSGGAGHAQSGVIKALDAGDAGSDGHATVLRSTNNIVVRLGT